MLFALPVIGALIGGAVNWCIYNLGDEKRPVSPWSRSEPGGYNCRLIDRVPVIGWILRRRQEDRFGKGFWLRPLAIELIWAIGLPLFYLWHQQGGLTGSVPAPEGWTIIWFFGHSILIAFLFIATFIDFDQRIIPDGITIPGTIIALIIAAVWPSFRLPEVVSNLVGQRIVPINFADAQPMPTWHHGPNGLAIGLAIFAVWIAALLPKFPLAELNIKSLRLVVASTIRFLQQNNLKVRRRTRRIGLIHLAIGAAGLLAIAVAWRFLSPAQLDSLFGALVGLGFGGLMVWSVRIVASHSLGREAMGFGDVTLMAMIGAFLGWQAALIVFALSPFAALAIVLVTYLITRESELAFGPYLCFSAVITIFGWSDIWPWARDRFFLMPGLLMAVLAGSLILLMLMMLGIRIIKGGELPDTRGGNSDA